MDNKKILILANSGFGLYHFRKELLSELIHPGSYFAERKAAPARVYISLPNDDKIPELTQLGCEFLETNFNRRGTNPVSDRKLLNEYKKLLKKVNPDVVLTYTIKPDVYGGIACASCGIPYVTNITGLGSAVENRSILQKLTCRLYKYGLRNAQMVFFQNKENEEFFTKKKILSGMHRVLPGSGVNLQYYLPCAYKSDNIVEFVFVARIMKMKGIDQYLEAARYIRAKYPQTRFHVCGTCEDSYEEILEEEQNSGIIIYHGRVNDMRQIYSQIHCVVHPTYYPEGLSNVLLEASASARPIITTDRSGCREVIDNGINGFVVRQRDSKDLIEKIEKFIALPFEQKKNMGLAGRTKVEREFDRKIVVDAYLQEINGIKEKA